MDVLSRGSNARMPVLNFDPKGERIYFMESPPVPRRRVRPPTS